MIRTRTQLLVLVLAMLALGLAWTIGYRSYFVKAAGSVVFGLAFICPQFRTDRGVWMGSVLIVVIVLIQASLGILLIRSEGAEVVAFTTEAQRLGAFVGVAGQIAFAGFASYASVVNFRLFRSVSTS